MRAVVIDTERHDVAVRDVPDAEAGPGQVLVAVHATGLNRADLAAKAGRYRTGASGSGSALPVAGSEFAGEVIGLGAGVSGWQVGDRVMAMGRGQAELVAVAAAHAIRVPAEFDWVQAGGFPMALETMFDALVSNGQLTSGQTVVINAAAGVGVVGIGMAAALGAASVVATSRSARKLAVLEEFLSDLGGCALTTIDTSTQGYLTGILAATGDTGADLIIDHIGAAVLEDNIGAVAVGGRIVQVGRLGGKVATFDLDELARKRVSLIGVTFRTRNDADKAALVRSCVDTLGDRMGGFPPRIERTYRLDDVVEAHAALASGDGVGKIVLLP